MVSFISFNGIKSGALLQVSTNKFKQLGINILQLYKTLRNTTILQNGQYAEVSQSGTLQS